LNARKENVSRCYIKAPFIYEFETLGQLEQFAEENSLSKRSIHHEIYLVDFTTGGSQENLKTRNKEAVSILKR
jgi:hypothetical protein